MFEVDLLVSVHVEHVEGDLESRSGLRQHAKQEQIFRYRDEALEEEGEREVVEE